VTSGGRRSSSCSATVGTSLYAFDLLELNGKDLRREPIEVRARPP
jgi:ATP-dependent DNA ligase